MQYCHYHRKFANFEHEVTSPGSSFFLEKELHADQESNYLHRQQELLDAWRASQTHPPSMEFYGVPKHYLPLSHKV